MSIKRLTKRKCNHPKIYFIFLIHGLKHLFVKFSVFYKNRQMTFNRFFRDLFKIFLMYFVSVRQVNVAYDYRLFALKNQTDLSRANEEAIFYRKNAKQLTF